MHTTVPHLLAVDEPGETPTRLDLYTQPRPGCPNGWPQDFEEALCPADSRRDPLLPQLLTLESLGIKADFDHYQLQRQEERYCRKRIEEYRRSMNCKKTATGPDCNRLQPDLRLRFTCSRGDPVAVRLRFTWNSTHGQDRLGPVLTGLYNHDHPTDASTDNDYYGLPNTNYGHHSDTRADCNNADTNDLDLDRPQQQQRPGPGPFQHRQQHIATTSTRSTTTMMAATTSCRQLWRIDSRNVDASTTTTTAATTLRRQPPWHVDSRNNNMPTTATHQQPQRQHIDNNYDDHSNNTSTTTTTTTSTGINTRNDVDNNNDININTLASTAATTSTTTTTTTTRIDVVKFNIFTSAISAVAVGPWPVATDPG
ncbi:hypothetical protein EDB89DRAFT_1904760 [Lactarius sanguifluus]|nr:hypothetical protein EDB89DRAFT_1904760 [Lactarius sanguifluus]